MLKTLYDGPRPSHYQPMKKQGSIILGIGGDNSDSAHGTFYGKQPTSACMDVKQPHLFQCASFVLSYMV